jgi:acyl carrier protein
MTKPRLSDLMRDYFEGVDFDPDAPGLGAGAFEAWDSFAHFNLLLLIEESYAVRFSVDDMTNLKGVADIRAALAARGIAA